MAFTFLTVLALGRMVAATSPTSNQHAVLANSKAPGAQSFALRKANNTLASSHNNTRSRLRGAHILSTEPGVMPCHCQATDPSWKQCARTTPKCVFIDLGAADGNTFQHFMNNGYGPVANCPSSDWQAVLVEANPRFNEPLQQIQARQMGKVTSMSSTAAYMCEGKTSFYLDTINHEKNYWGSSMSSNHRDIQAGDKQKVEVPTMNLMKVLYEQTIPGDWVMLKMDIEGSEFDVLPCLALAPAANLVDRLYLEQHDPSWGLAGTSAQQMEIAKSTLRQRGIDIPNYFSETL